MISIDIKCPSVGPVTIAITAIQGSAKTGSIKCRGAAATMETTVRDATDHGCPDGRRDRKHPGGWGVGPRLRQGRVRQRPREGLERERAQLGPLSSRLQAAHSGTRRALTTTATPCHLRTLTRSGWATIALVSKSSTGAGDDGTVTASSAGRSVDAAVHFSGNPTTCTITADPANPAAGSTVDLTVLLLDSSGGPALTAFA